MIFCKDYDLNNFKVVKFQGKEKNEEGKKVNVDYCDNIITTDIETTSYYILEGKALQFDYKKDAKFYKTTTPQSLMYIWMVGLDDQVIYGRTYDEYYEFMVKLTRHIGCKYFVYIHNMAFDWQFLRNALGNNCELFARQKRKPMKIEYKDFNVEFRCSLFLTNKSLKSAIKDCNAPVEKMTGDLDYDLIRTPLTQLTEKEIKYCENDILGLYYVIKEKKDYFKHIKYIPLTKTGKVRREFKEVMKYNKKYKDNVKFSWPDWNEFKMLSRVYAGGYTHANRFYTNKTIENVFSYDIGSSYPYILATQKFPTRKFVESYNKDLNFLDTEKYAFIIDVTLENLECKTQNSFLSISKAITEDYDGTLFNNENIILDNGRILKVDQCRYILNDTDLIILNNTHTFKPRINRIWTAPKDYLPNELIEYILGLFQTKTIYKGDKLMESVYKAAKEDINSIYGMFVTKILSDLIELKQGEWKDDKLSRKDMLDLEKVKIKEEEYDNKLSEMLNEPQFCSYSTGVWCAAYARKHLWDIIMKMDEDVIYCDTDSVKFVNEENLKFFNNDYKNVKASWGQVGLFRDIDITKFTAYTPKGKKSELGVFELDAHYKEFKTLGAKKYAYTLYDDVEDKETGEVYPSGTVFITVAGVNKEKGRKYFENLDMFTPGTLLDYKFAGKNLLIYNDKQKPFTFEDGYTTEEKYGIVLTPTTYKLDITPDYSELIEQYLNNLADGLEVELELDTDNINFNVGDGACLL